MKVIKFLFLSAIVISLASCNNQTSTLKSLDSEIDSVSYALGMDMGLKIKMNFDDINQNAYVQGMKNGIDSTNMLLDSKGLTTVINTYFQKKQQEKMKEQQEAAAKKAETDEIDEMLTFTELRAIFEQKHLPEDFYATQFWIFKYDIEVASRYLLFEYFSELIKRRFILGSYILQKENQEKFFNNLEEAKNIKKKYLIILN